ncbi:hypothetical protein HBI95_159510 [Parastagonospora nodorum]|nr:hypothetical protein HBI95_159510 [Parastagonospora nodorum]
MSLCPTKKTQNHDFPAPPEPTPGDSMAEQTMALKTIYKTSNDPIGKKNPNRSPACLWERCAERSAIKHSSICNSSRSSNSTSEYPKPPTDLIKWGRCSKVKNLEGNPPPKPLSPLEEAAEVTHDCLPLNLNSTHPNAR